MARRWLPSLEGKAVSQDDATRRATAANGGYNGPSYANDWNIDRAIKDGYERVIWVFRAVDHIASSASRLPIELRVGDEQGPPAEGVAARDPILRLLNRVSNAWEPAAAFRYRMSSQLLLSKRGVFVEVLRSRNGSPYALHLLPVGATRPIPDETRFISEFEVIIKGVPQRVPAFEDDGVTPHIIWIRKPHPLDPYSGVTPMEAAGISIDMDFYARLYNRAFLQNDGRPGGLLGVKGTLDQEDKDELRSRFGGGPSQAGRTSVINTEGLSWVDTAINPRDAQFAEIMRITKTDILDAFGVYESLIGNASGRTFDNAAQEKRNFWQETMPPHLDLITGAFDYLTAGGIEDDLYLVHNTESVPIIQQDRHDREKSLKELNDAGVITVDEFREETGRDPYGTPGAQRLWIAGTKKDIDEEPPPAAEPPAAEPVEAAAPVSRETKALTESAEVITASINQRVKVYERTMKRYFGRQEKVVLDKLGGVKARRGTPLWDPPGTKAVEVGDVLDRSRWDEELAEDLEALVGDTYADEASEAGVDLDEEAAAAVLAARLSTAKQVNDTTEEKLAAALLLAKGDTADDVRRRVQAVYEEARQERAEVIAETEAMGATNDARDLVAKYTGATHKVWKTQGDKRVRETHALAEDQRQKVSDPFRVGGKKLRYPGDPQGPASEVIRCRCWVRYVDEGGKSVYPTTRKAADAEQAEDPLTMLAKALVIMAEKPLPENHITVMAPPPPNINVEAPAPATFKSRRVERDGTGHILRIVEED